MLIPLIGPSIIVGALAFIVHHVEISTSEDAAIPHVETSTALVEIVEPSFAAWNFDELHRAKLGWRSGIHPRRLTSSLTVHVH